MNGTRYGAYCAQCGFAHNMPSSQEHHVIEKQCKVCEIVKELAAFPRSNGSHDGHKHICIMCAEQQKNKQQELREDAKEQHEKENALLRSRGYRWKKVVRRDIDEEGWEAQWEELVLISPDGHEVSKAEALRAIANNPAPAQPRNGGHDGWHPRAVISIPDMHSPDTAAARARRRDWARAILAAPDEWAILDTETTDKKRGSDIIDIALIDLTGRVLYTSLVQPTQPIHPEVVAKTRIIEAQAARAPDFAAVYERIQPIIESRCLLVYNVEFDIKYILQPQIARQCGIRWEPRQAECLMLAYSEYRGERYSPHSRHTGEYVYHRFEEACRQMGVSTGSQVHRALPDCRQSLDLLQAMASSDSTS